MQQDLALVNLIGIRHVERNGHHYVNGMAGLPAAEQTTFLTEHPDLYERSHGAVRLKIRAGQLAFGRLPGQASPPAPIRTGKRLPLTSRSRCSRRGRERSER